MEANIWQLFAQVAKFLSNLFASSNNQKSLNNGGALPNVQENGAASISTWTSVINQAPENILRIRRNPTKATADALFGDMVYREQWICYTMERTVVAIPEGTYRGYKRDSEHFGMRVVGIDVPNRTNIECHPANKPEELEGCVAVGSAIDNGALDNSKIAFDKMMSLLPEEFTVIVSSNN